jgi:hypothetical protein
MKGRLFKSAGFIGLVEPGVQQHDCDVAERENTNNKTEVSTQAENGLCRRGPKLPLFGD